MKLPGLQYTSPNRFTFKQRVTLRIIPPLVAYLFRALMAICRVDVRGRATYEAALARHPAFLFAFWHETMAIAGVLHRGSNFHTLTSYSYDGELAARVISCWGEEAVRGSSSRGGKEGLRELEKALGPAQVVGLTLDGPRGPRRVAKVGLVVLAARKQAPIVPIAFAVDRAWRMRSWDRFAIPKPGAHVVIVYGDEVAPPASEAPDVVEACRLLVEERLNAMHEALEQELGCPQGVDRPV